VKRFSSEKWSVWSFDNGLQTLPDTIARYLQQSVSNVGVRTNTRCTRLHFTTDSVQVQSSLTLILAKRFLFFVCVKFKLFVSLLCVCVNCLERPISK